MTQNVRFKIKQFQWFEMETKVRQIIQEVLGPIQKRILESSALINKLKSSQAEDELRIEEISLMIANDPKVFETGVFASVDRKFMQHSKLIQQLSRQIQQQNKYIENKFKILDLRMQQSSEVLRNIASLKQRVSKQMQIQNDNINSLRMNIQHLIEELNVDIRETRNKIAENSEVSQKRDCSIEEEIRRIKQNILTIEDNVSLHRQMHKEKTIQLEEHEKIVQRHSEQIRDLIDNKHLTKRLSDYVSDMDSQIKKVLFKVDSISPLITQAQISDCLQAILPTKMQNKISIFEHRRYFQLNKQILQKDYKKISNIFNGLELLQNRQKKCTRQIIQLKRKKLIQMGIDIDHATYQDREKYYAEISLDDQFNVDMEETKVKSEVNQSDIKRIIDKFLVEYMSSFQEKIRIDIEDNKRYIYSVEEEIRHEVGKFQASIIKVRNHCSAFHTENVLEMKLVNNLYRTNQNAIKQLEMKFNQHSDLQRLFYNFCSLINHLSIQDQIDKQNISLLGAKQTTLQEPGEIKQKNSVVALDGKCFSCNGYPATTLTAFKMACLTYNPSSIKIDNKEYKREQLLQFTTNMLQTIKKYIQLNQKNLIKSNTSIDEATQHKKTELDSMNSREASPGNRIKSQTLNAYDPVDKGFKNSFISKHIETEGSQNNEASQPTGAKYRKKTLTTTYSSSYTKRKHSLKKAAMHEQMLKTNIIFNSLKKKNQSYLN